MCREPEAKQCGTIMNNIWGQVPVAKVSCEPSWAPRGGQRPGERAILRLYLEHPLGAGHGHSAAYRVASFTGMHRIPRSKMCPVGIKKVECKMGPKTGQSHAKCVLEQMKQTL